MANNELLDRTLNYIKEHPDEWDQSTWQCGTSMCFAGTAAILAGGKWVNPGGASGILVAEPEDALSGFFVYGNDFVHVADRARRVLELSSSQADVLFDWTNELDDLEHYVHLIKEGILDEEC